ncbi:hypothetical protein L6452_32374 [Arctium lappa]|uniref:Uncharacterized protein n=1 Tax=Arctium lappa TaxID=4217 RepID=A0ACB8Z3I3_ARCLA|nr:hypothetical protein L6452_32374 [Arctium lappa]
MQNKIRVYESGWTEQEYDPDLLPELAATTGIHDILSENLNIGKTDLQGGLAKGFAHSRMQLPTGKSIQVETSIGERLPSIDTWPPRVCDLNAIIEIVLQASADDECVLENDGAEQPEDVPSKENPRASLEIADDIGSEDDHFDRPQAYNGDRASHFSETEVEDHLESRDMTSSYSKKLNPPHNLIERPTKRTTTDRSPRLTDSGTLQDKKLVDNQKEESTESVRHKKSPSYFHLTLGSAEDRSFDQNDAIKDEVVVDDGTSGMEMEGREHSSVERGEDKEDSKAERSSENSKAKSISSRYQLDMRDSMEQEVIQDGVQCVVGSSGDLSMKISILFEAEVVMRDKRGKDTKLR